MTAVDTVRLWLEAWNDRVTGLEDFALPARVLAAAARGPSAALLRTLERHTGNLRMLNTAISAHPQASTAVLIAIRDGEISARQAVGASLSRHEPEARA